MAEGVSVLVNHTSVQVGIRVGGLAKRNLLRLGLTAGVLDGPINLSWSATVTVTLAVTPNPAIAGVLMTSAMGEGCMPSKLQERPVVAAIRDSVVVASVDFRIGGLVEDEDYQFADVRGLVLLPDHRIVVADRIVRRVTMYSHEGQFVSNISRPGEGPGEFDLVSVMAVDPREALWLFTSNGPQGKYVVFSLQGDGASYVKSVAVDQYTESRRPAFGSDGLVGVVVRESGSHGIRLWLSEDGAIVRQHRLPRLVPGSELGYRVITLPGPRSGFVEVAGPFAPRDWLAHAPSGEYARCVTAHYEIDLYDAEGRRKQRIVLADQIGPRLTARERQREESVIDSLRAVSEPVEYPDFAIPDRKPVIKFIWYDADGRLWVQLWEEDGASVSTAHVYDGVGAFLFSAEWPLEVSLRHGAVRDGNAVGVEKGAFDVPEIVRMTFRPR